VFTFSIVVAFTTLSSLFRFISMSNGREGKEEKCYDVAPKKHTHKLHEI
jgi:hypothetical protein